MYSWIWRHLPGPVAARVFLAFLLAAAVVAVLMFAVFPAVEPHVPFSGVTVDQPPAPG